MTDLLRSADGFADCSDSSANCGRDPVGLDHEASFSLGLFPDGYTIGKPTQGLLLPLLEDAPELFHPYDSASKSLFHAIECGWLPGDLFDCIPCKYFNGAVICEVLDFRTLMSKVGDDDFFANEWPKVQKVRLRMGMENVVKDISFISDNSWTYNDLLQVESRIIRILQPVLDLGSNPSDRVYNASYTRQLDFGTYRCNFVTKEHGKRESRQFHKWTVSSNGVSENLNCPNYDCFKDGVTSVSQCSPAGTMPIVCPDNSEKDILRQALPLASQAKDRSTTCSVFAHNTASGASSIPAVTVEDISDSCVGVKSSVALLRKRSRNSVESNPAVKGSKKDQEDLGKLPFKRLKKEQAYLGTYQSVTSQQANPSEPKWQDEIIMSERQQDAHFLQHLRPDVQNCTRQKASETNAGKSPVVESQFSPPLHEGDLQVGIKEEPVETEIVSKTDVGKDKNECALTRNEKSNCQQRVRSRRSLPPLMQETYTCPFIEKSPVKRTSRQRRVSQVPQDSAVVSNCSHVSKRGESLSLRTSSNMHSKVAPGRLEIDKGLSVSVASAGAAVKSSFINSLAKSYQTPVSMKESKVRSEVASPMSGIDSPAVVVGSRPFQQLSGTYFNEDILQIFSKIEMVVKRHGLKNKKEKVRDALQKEVLLHFTLPKIPEDNEKLAPLKDRSCMSNCIIGGSRNSCQTRTLTYLRLKLDYKGNYPPFLVDESLCKLVLFASETVGDHRVEAALVYGDKEQAGQHIPLAVFPSVYLADLFAAQFTSLMKRDGYKLVADHFQSAPASTASNFTDNSLLMSYSGLNELPPLALISSQLTDGASLTGSGLSFPISYRLSYHQREGFSNLNSTQVQQHLHTEQQELQFLQEWQKQQQLGSPYQCVSHLMTSPATPLTLLTELVPGWHSRQ